VRSEFGDEEEKRKMRMRYRKPSHFDRFWFAEETEVRQSKNKTKWAAIEIRRARAP
jgi:hypothetical protein